MALSGTETKMKLSEIESILQEMQRDSTLLTDKCADAMTKHAEWLKTSEDRLSKLLNECEGDRKRLEVSQTDDNTNMATGHGSPYVVGLFDANNAYFKDALLSANGQGGTNVGLLLKRAIIEHVRGMPSVPHNSHIVVRMYGDLRWFSKAVARARLINLNTQPWGLVPFASSFTATSPFFDFIDTGERKVTKIKISENFDMYNKDPNCRHVLFGVGLVATYVDILRSNKIQKEKLTLVRTGTSNPAYECLGLKMMEINDVFYYTTRPERGLVSALAPPTIARDRTGTLRRFNEDGSTYARGGWKGASDKKERSHSTHHVQGDCGDPSCKYDHTLARDTDMDSLNHMFDGADSKDEIRNLPGCMHDMDQKVSEFVDANVDAWSSSTESMSTASDSATQDGQGFFDGNLIDL